MLYGGIYVWAASVVHGVRPQIVSERRGSHRIGEDLGIGLSASRRLAVGTDLCVARRGGAHAC